jgi:hypothetical protein
LRFVLPGHEEEGGGAAHLAGTFDLDNDYATNAAWA